MHALFDGAVIAAVVERANKGEDVLQGQQASRPRTLLLLGSMHMVLSPDAITLCNYCRRLLLPPAPPLPAAAALAATTPESPSTVE